jgi:glucan phosphoethanolaminetransferase (alkaline phosphatase superfamily)
VRNSTRTSLLWVAAIAALVSGWVHLYLYFRGGYRGIAPESVLGLTISRSFALNALAAVAIAELLVLATRFERLVAPAAFVGTGFGAATLVAYFLSRTTGLLGFEESATTTEAVVAMVAEAVLLLCLVPVLPSAVAHRRAVAPTATEAPEAAAGGTA